MKIQSRRHSLLFQNILSQIQYQKIGSTGLTSKVTKELNFEMIELRLYNNADVNK